MESHGAAVLRRPELRDCPWIGCDARDAHSLDKALSSSGVDLVVHAAGPFQGDAACSPLEAAIRHGVPYMDVCDDATYAQRAKRLEPAARAAGVPALSTAGIFPGLSNVMAADMVTRHAGGRAPARVLYSYYTAGTGGAGPTILETTFLLAGQDVVVYRDGKQLTVPAISNRRPVDFGTTIGTKSVYLYNLPETHTGRAVFQAPSISARFGIDPGVFNVAMILVARLLPKRWLEDRALVQTLAKLTAPLVALVDRFAGDRVGMLIEVELEDGKVLASLYVHDHLAEGMGAAVAAFAASMLKNPPPPGVWYPEEACSVPDRSAFFSAASEGARTFQLGRAAWEIGSTPRRFGMGIYL